MRRGNYAVTSDKSRTFIGGLLKEIVHCPGLERSTLRCSESGISQADQKAGNRAIVPMCWLTAVSATRIWVIGLCRYRSQSNYCVDRAHTIDRVIN
jgi:hypothetical protein